jgi:Lipocalin-like domain
MDVLEARAALVGAWRLLSYEDRSTVEGSWTSTFGNDPRGLIVYHDSGLLSVQIAAAPEDDAAPWRYIGYLGTFEVQAAERQEEKIVGIVLHHMDVAYPRELLEEEPERDFEVEGDALMLGDGLTARRILQRIDRTPFSR